VYAQSAGSAGVDTFGSLRHTTGGNPAAHAIAHAGSTWGPVECHIETTSVMNQHGPRGGAGEPRQTAVDVRRALHVDQPHVPQAQIETAAVRSSLCLPSFMANLDCVNPRTSLSCRLFLHFSQVLSLPSPRSLRMRLPT
jgi:hypothetical protein